jgi:hypothetical protein
MSRWCVCEGVKNAIARTKREVRVHHTMQEDHDGAGSPAPHGRALEERERFAARKQRLAVDKARPRRCLCGARAHCRERVGR